MSGKRPRACRRRRGRQAALARRRRYLIAGAHVQEEVGAHDERLVEHDGAQARHRADHHAEDAPLREVRGRGRPAARSCAEAAGPNRPAGMRGRIRRPAHRSHPALQSCSGASPAASARWVRASTTERWVSGGIGAMSAAISRRRRTVTASMSSRACRARERCAPGGGHVDPLAGGSIPSSPAARTAVTPSAG